MLLDKIGITTHPAEAAYMLQHVAAAGDRASQSQLGARYYLGIGVPQDYKLAASWFLKAAQQNDTRAQFCLAVMNCKKQGMDGSETEAYKWLLIAGKGFDAETVPVVQFKRQMQNDLSLGRQEIARSLATQWQQEAHKRKAEASK